MRRAGTQVELSPLLLDSSQLARPGGSSLTPGCNSFSKDLIIIQGRLGRYPLDVIG